MKSWQWPGVKLFFTSQYQNIWRKAGGNTSLSKDYLCIFICTFCSFQLQFSICTKILPLLLGIAYDKTLPADMPEIF